MFHRSNFLREKTQPNQFFGTDERINDYGKQKALQQKQC